ncbi:MAG: hypothetical protein HZA10_05865 [Nitrospirae bacterium]|nr:hypothetical protein [Nitrospirota bacterium]
MSPFLGVLIMMNNYFHDVATALLMASGIVVWVIVRRYDSAIKTKETTEYFLRIYNSATKLARFSLVWIIIGGVPRTIFYTEFEWANAAGKNQIPALLVKHVLAFVFVGIGAYIWLKINRRVKDIKKQTDVA